MQEKQKQKMDIYQKQIERQQEKHDNMVADLKREHGEIITQIQEDNEAKLNEINEFHRLHHKNLDRMTPLNVKFDKQ